MSTTERCAADDRTNTLIVSAIPQTLARVSRLLAELDCPVEDVAGPPRFYRVEVVLLQGGKTGEIVAIGSRGILLSFPVSSMVRERAVKPGAKVKPGDLIARLDSTQAQRQVNQVQARLAEMQAKLGVAEASYAIAREQHKNGVTSKERLIEAEAALETARAQYEAARQELELAEMQVESHTLKAPLAGTIASVSVNLYEFVSPGQTVATLVPDEKTEATTGAALGTIDPKVGLQYGITAEDLKSLGLEGLVELGKGLVMLAAEKGDVGHALVSLTDAYRCELEFLDVRPPYVIIRGRLVGTQLDKPLLENTLFLEKDKPSVLGLTNLKQALILVVRLHEGDQADESKVLKRRPAARR